MVAEILWCTFSHPDGIFTLKHPAAWTVSDHGHFATIDGELTTLAVSSYLQPGASLTEFATHRFRVESDIYPPVGPPQPYDTAAWKGLAQESRGIFPGETEPTVRLMLCVRHESLFVSMTLYTTPDDFVENRERYDTLFHSLNFSPDTAAGRRGGVLARLLRFVRPRPFEIPKATPCPSCGEPLRTQSAKQCRHCGADWHEA